MALAKEKSSKKDLPGGKINKFTDTWIIWFILKVPKQQEHRKKRMWQWPKKNNDYKSASVKFNGISAPLQWVIDTFILDRKG